MDESIEPMPKIDQQQPAERRGGSNLVGPDRMLAGLTKNVLETALEAEAGEHLGRKRTAPRRRPRGVR
jgi:hypothetical protein